MTVEIRPLDGALGAEVRGLDPRQPLGEDVRAALIVAWREHLVLVIHGHPVSDPELIAFSRNFGELEPPGPNPYGAPHLSEHPELNVISNVREGNALVGNLGAGEAVWHADQTYIDVPPKAAVLHALEIPDDGGNTYFANMFMAYETLSATLKERINGRAAIHDAAHNSAGMLRKGYEETADVRETTGAHHPLVRTDPETGRQALFLGRRPHSYVLDLDVVESEKLLDDLWAHATRPEFTMAHEWRVADTLIWNNLSVLHRRDAFDESARRIMHRAQIRSEHPVI